VFVEGDRKKHARVLDHFLTSADSPRRTSPIRNCLFHWETAMTNHLDVRGQTCPGPTTETLNTLKLLPDGATLNVVSDYLPARYTIPSLMNDLRYPTIVHDNDDGTFTVIIQKVARVAS